MESRASTSIQLHILLIACLASSALNCRLGCSTDASDSVAESGSTTKPALKNCTPAPKTTEYGGPLHWYNDDFVSARACARKLKRPLLIDLWAPWCHTCISMQGTIMNDPSLSKYAEQFVWVAIDTDRPASAPVVRRYPPLAWPTFYVIAPEDGALLSRFVGGASLEQFKALLDEGLKASERRPPSLISLIQAAHDAERQKNWPLAGQIYDQALAEAPEDWPRRPDILVSRMRTHVRANTCPQSLVFIQKEGTRTGASASAADFLSYAHRCIETLGGGAKTHATTLAPLAKHVRAAVESRDDNMSMDDKSDALRILREVALTQGRTPEARRLAERQRTLLDQAIREAESPELAMAYGWPASEVYAFLGRPQAFVPVLKRSMEALPDAYDPPYRLAWLLLKAGQAEEALAPAQRALGLVYGPRKARAFDLIASIQKARGNQQGELEARKGTVQVLEGLPPGQRDDNYLRQARKDLALLKSR